MSRRRRYWLPLLLVSLTAPPSAATTYSHGPVPVEEEIDLRALPSLVVEWRSQGTVDEWRLDEGRVFTVGGGRLGALDAVTGQTLWEYALAQDCSCSKLEVLPSRVAAGIDGRLILVDRASGALVADVALGKSIRWLIADPLIAAYRGPLESSGLVRLDEFSGVEIARYALPGNISRVHALDDRLVVAVSRQGVRRLLVGLDHSLREVWRRELPAGSFLEREGDELFASSWSNGRSSKLALDPATGALASSSVTVDEREALGIHVESLAGGLVQVLRTGEPPTLLRPGRRGRDPRWQTALPAVAAASAVWRGRVVLTSKRWGGRSLLLVVDRDSGAILRRAAGLHRMSDLKVSGDLLLSETASGLAAVRLDRFGPPEASTSTVEETVRAILASLRGDGAALDPYDVRHDLEALGEAALPFLVEEIPAASDEVVEMIAALAADHRYRGAGAPVAARVARILAQPVDPAEPAWRRERTLVNLALALAATAGPRQVPMLERLLEPAGDLGEPAGELGAGRLTVLAALGRLAPERALELLDGLRARHRPRGSWYEPPAAGPWIEVAAQGPPSPDSYEDYEDLPEEEARKRLLRGSAALTAPGSERWVVFPSYLYGGEDLWAAPVDESGRAGEARYLGRRPARGEARLRGSEPAPLGARRVGEALDVGFAGGDRLVVDVAELVVDRDGDGLTDRLEAHLRLDPASRDSDGDGLDDAEDPAPNGGRTSPSREEQAFLALHETLALVHAADLERPGAEPRSPLNAWHDSRAALLSRVPPLEWRAGAYPTFVVSDRQGDDCELSGYRLASFAPRALAPDELVVEQYLACPGEPEVGTGFGYILRETPAGWVVTGEGS